jgi:hypothetical protein
VNFGPFTDLLHALNDHPGWREVYGTKSVRLKDQELILRFLALTFDFENYSRPMRVFLNRFMEKHKALAPATAASYATRFSSAIEYIAHSLGRRSFRPERSLNTAVYDATMVGLSERLNAGPIRDNGEFTAAYDRLLANPDFKDAYTRSTADEEKVKLRISLAKRAFADVQ